MLPVGKLKTWGSLFLAWVILLAPISVTAQSQADKTFAQEAFKQGQIQYNLGRFEKALEHFLKPTRPCHTALFSLILANVIDNLTIIKRLFSFSKATLGHCLPRPTGKKLKT